MIPNSFPARVTADSCVIPGLLSLPAAWFGGAPVGLGLLAGGALGAMNFWWLSRRAVIACSMAAPEPTFFWMLSSGLRFFAVGVACAILFLTGLAHPVGVLAGLTVVPCVVVWRGFASARAEMSETS